MAKEKRKLPLAIMKRIIRDAGAEYISKDAQERMAEVLEQIGTNIAKNAIIFARHAGRKKVNASDIMLASK